MKHRFIVAGVTTVFALLLCLQAFAPAYGAEQEGEATTPAAQEAQPEGMMHGGSGMMGRMHCMKHGGMGHMGGPMMFMRKGPGMGMGMEMMSMYADPKTRGQMMEIRGRMLQEMGKLMEERGKEIAAEKK